MKIEFFSGQIDTDATHHAQLSIRLYPQAVVKIWVRSTFETVRTKEGVHGRSFPINGGTL